MKHKKEQIEKHKANQPKETNIQVDATLTNEITIQENVPLITEKQLADIHKSIM